MSSMIRSPRLLATLALGAGAAMALAAPGLAAKPANPGKPGKPAKTTIKVSRGATTLTLTPGALTALNGVTIKVLKPARSTADGPAFPITQGRLTVTKANGAITGVTGAIAHTGGLQLSKAGKTVRLRNLVIKLDANPDLTAQVKLGKGKAARASVFDLAPDLTKISVTGTKKKTLTVTDVAVKLNAASAGLLNSYFGTSFATDATVGTAVVKTRIIG